MKKALIIGLLIAVAAGMSSWYFQPDAKWSGVDESVVKKFAEEAGRPPSDPLLNFSGDVLLFMFLMAGLVGGFVAGYYYRELFSSDARQVRNTINV